MEHVVMMSEYDDEEDEKPTTSSSLIGPSSSRCTPPPLEENQHLLHHHRLSSTSGGSAAAPRPFRSSSGAAEEATSSSSSSSSAPGMHSMIPLLHNTSTTTTSCGTSTSSSTELQGGIRKRMKRSSVWDVFVKTDNEVHCKLCDAKLKYFSSTTSMMYHIRNKHSHTPQVEDQHHLHHHPGTGASGVDPPPQAAIEAMSHSEVTQRICVMLEKDMLPLSMVDGAGFRELLAYVARDYAPPTAEEVAAHVETHFRSKARELRQLLDTAEAVALCTERWAAAPAERYVTVYCHFITEDWHARRAVLQTHAMPPLVSQTVPSVSTTDDFAEKLVETVGGWGLAGRVTACVCDDAKNVAATAAVHSCARGTWDSVVCFARALQASVGQGVSGDLLAVVAAAGRLAKHFNGNSHAGVALELRQAQMCLPGHALIQSSKDRWETIGDMFERLIEQRWAVKAVLSDRTVTSRQEAHVLDMKDECWQTIEDIAPVLATLKWAMTVASAETEASVSNIYPITFSLLHTHLTAREHESKAVTEFKIKVRESLRKHMEVDASDLASKPALMASMLDPRHKHLSFLTPTVRLAAKVKLHEMVSKLDAISSTVLAAKIEKMETIAAHPVSHASQPKAGDAKNAMLLLLGDNYSSSYADDSEAQVEYYLRDISPSLDINPLDWWRVNAPRFPGLAILAKRYLCIPGVSVPSNLMSEEDRRTYARMRARLSPEHVDMMIFLNKNG